MILVEFRRPDKKSQFVCPAQVVAVTTDPVHQDITLITIASGGAIPVIDDLKTVVEKLKNAKEDGG